MCVCVSEHVCVWGRGLWGRWDGVVGQEVAVAGASEGLLNWKAETKRGTCYDPELQVVLSLCCHGNAEDHSWT